MLLAVLSMQALTSIQHIYEWFMRGLGKVSKNAYYYMMSYTGMPLDKFAGVTMRKAIGAIDEKLAKLPVLLLIDDTLQAKYGTKFECWEKMFDHARHNGSSYLSGHCFVSLAVCVPVMVEQTVKYLTVPIRFRLRGKDENKLTIASEMIREAMKTLADIPTVVLLCDSWYPKGEVLETVSSYSNLDLIANVRVDTVLYDLPKHPTGKRGRPAKKGKKLSIYGDFDFTQVGKYFIAARTGITNLFKIPVYITVTTTNIDAHKGYRLFLSTIDYDKLYAAFSSCQYAKNDPPKMAWLTPLYLYSLRWNIEVMFYELKSFWSFGHYMLRSKSGIENFVNSISISYAAAKLIPFEDSFFADFALASTQATKFALGDAIRKDLFFTRFVDFLETRHISSGNFHDLDFFDFFDFSS
jgi:hypothetical protein